MSSVLGFVDRIGSNSSGISRYAAKELNWSHASFGDYIRKEIRARGLEDTRLTEQQVGKLLIAEGWEKFCRGVLEEAKWQPGQRVIVDGIRHIDALETIERITETQVITIYVEADDAIRKARLIGHDVENEAEFETAEADATEQEVKTILPKMADLVVDARESPEQIVPKIRELVKRYIDDPQADDAQADAVTWLKQAESLAPARQRGQDKKQHLLEAEGGIVNVDQAATLLNVTPELVDEQRQHGSLIGIEIENVGFVYPRWQFVQDETLPGLRDVLAELRNCDSWSQLAFMLNPNIRLQGETPLGELRHGRVLEVQRAARAYGEQGGA